MVVSMLEELGAVISTNDEMRMRIEGGAVHGAAVWADAQSKGRGRLGRSWFSPEGKNLYLSLAIVRPEAARFVGWIPLAVGLGTARAIESVSGVAPWLKWPNDLWLDDRKLGGVLCEGVVREGRLHGVVAGVGVNVSTRAEEVPDDLRDVMTSLAIAGAEVGVKALAEQVRLEIVNAVDALLDGGVDRIRAEWLDRDRLVGSRIDVHEQNATFSAEAIGLGSDGSLRVRLDDGSEKAVIAGDVSVRAV